MLYDRQYMKFPSMKQGFSLNEQFILTLIIVFVIQKAFHIFTQGRLIEEVFALSVPSFSNGLIWSTITYAFLHHGPFHLIFNLLLIYIMGRVIERELPSADFIALCLISAITGGLLWLSVNYFNVPKPEQITEISFPKPSQLIGASAVSSAFLSFFCATRPNEPIRFLLFLILPVTLKPKIILYAYLGMEFYFFIFEELAPPVPNQSIESVELSNSIAHSAHLGGIAAGYIFCLLYKKGYQLPTFKLKPSQIKSSKLNPRNHTPSDFKVNISGHDNMQTEIDRILDKINDKGFGSLTDEEKLSLDKAKSFLNKNN